MGNLATGKVPQATSQIQTWLWDVQTTAALPYNKMSNIMNSNSTHEAKPKLPKHVVRRYKLRGSIKTHDDDNSSSSTPSPRSSTTTSLGLATIHKDTVHKGPIHEGPVHEDPSYVHQGPVFVHDDYEKQSATSSSNGSSSSTSSPPTAEEKATITANHTTNTTTTTTTTNPPTGNSCHMTSAFILMEQHSIDIETVTNEQWEEIMWYQVAVVRKQRREKRRGGHQTHCGEIFAGPSETEEGESVKAEGKRQ
ncbi:hypothetical protein B0T09DRAFT_310063 [Sordaria sp. MPI-SDFR-AT-0083]|nr:hypothetical protein B0T09DRAFT_310063 [Sordaria sp. MPI-SDFR-AT-0083]